MHVVMKGIYFDTSTKGKIGKHHHSYRAEVQIDGVRRRARFLTYAAARRWQKMMRSQDDGLAAQQRAEREAERRRQLAELEAERRRRLLERERQKLDALADRMVRAIAVPPRNCDILDWRKAWDLWITEKHPQKPQTFNEAYKGTVSFMDWYMSKSEKEGGNNGK